MSQLLNKVCVITGAAGGIGRASVSAFSREGAVVVAVDLKEEVDAAMFVSADLTDESQVQQLYASVVERFGRVDVLFNNAGIAHREDGSILDVSRTTWQHVLETNLTSVFYCCKYGIPHLRQSGGGSVINMASVVAVMGSAESQIAYTASKGGVLAMSRELGVEFADQGIRVNALCPGPVETALLSSFFTPDEWDRRLVHIPAGRFARVSEIAEAAVFLASDSSSYVNATEFLVDGGLSSAYVTSRDVDVDRH
jgi:NAD(P)-dependent dehydrogenase (short-subunit alcohol dehydrogenase family)